MPDSRVTTVSFTPGNKVTTVSFTGLLPSVTDVTVVITGTLATGFRHTCLVNGQSGTKGTSKLTLAKVLVNAWPRETSGTQAM